MGMIPLQSDSSDHTRQLISAHRTSLSLLRLDSNKSTQLSPLRLTQEAASMVCCACLNFHECRAATKQQELGLSAGCTQQMLGSAGLYNLQGVRKIKGKTTHQMQMEHAQQDNVKVRSSAAGSQINTATFCLQLMLECAHTLLPFNVG